MNMLARTYLKGMLDKGFHDVALFSLATCVCSFQEVDKFHDLEEELKPRGYCGIWKVCGNM